MMNFFDALQQAIDGSARNNFTDNWDYRRFGPSQPLAGKKRFKDFIKTALASVGLYRSGLLKYIHSNTANFEWLYERLVDDESRQTLLKVLAYRVMGHRKVKMPLNCDDYWRKLEELEARANNAETIDLGFCGWKLHKFDLAPEGYPIQMFARAPGVFTQLLLQQYRCQLKDRVIEVEPGDTVIDAGGCYGDTALYFAHKASEMGRVFSFEFMPENIKIFSQNLALNPHLATRIELVEHPLWSTSGMNFFVEGIGPASHVTSTPKDTSAKQVETFSIDDLVKNKSLDKIGFIKMDIEGAELEALNGAQETIRRFKPKLAISVYHNLQDFWAISQWIDSLNLGYQFSLRHFTIHSEETVLFAAVVV